MRDLPGESACKHTGHSAPALYIRGLHTHCRFSYGPCGIHNTMVDTSIAPRTGAAPWTSRRSLSPSGILTTHRRDVAMTVPVPIGHSYNQSNSGTRRQVCALDVTACSCPRSILAFGNSGEKTQLDEARHHYDGDVGRAIPSPARNRPSNQVMVVIFRTCGSNP